MSAFLYILFDFVAIASIVFAILNLIIAAITKRVFKALVNFSWLIISSITTACSLIFFKGFTMPTSGSVFLAQINYIFTAINKGVLIALITLIGFVLLSIILLFFIIKTIKHLIIGIKNTASKTKTKIDDIFTKKEVKETTANTIEQNESSDSNLQN